MAATLTFLPESAVTPVMKALAPVMHFQTKYRPTPIWPLSANHLKNKDKIVPQEGINPRPRHYE